MFKGFLIGRRVREVEEDGYLSYDIPQIIRDNWRAGFTRCRCHSLRDGYTTELPEMEVFYVELHDDDVMAVRNDPNTYMLNADMSDFEPVPLANWLKSKGETAQSFAATRGRYNQTRPEFITAMDRVEAEMW